jgi:hypothetical protein
MGKSKSVFAVMLYHQVPIFRFLPAATVFLVAMAGVSIGYGCSVCGCSLSSDWAAQGYSTTPGFKASVRYEYSKSSQLRSGDAPISPSDPFVVAAAGETQQSTFNRVTVLGLDYATGGKWGVALDIPYINRDHTTLGDGDPSVSSSEASGLGDLRVLARYQVHSFARSFGFQIGLKLPTGRIDQNFDSGPGEGQLLDRGLQLGSGTTDLLAGVSYFSRLTPNLGAFASALIDQPLAERADYLPSASVTLNTGLRLLNETWLTPQLQINTRFDTRERGIEGDANNSGGTFVYLSPGVTAEIGEHLHAFAFVQLPVYQYVNGVQLEPRWLLSTGVTYKF